MRLPTLCFVGPMVGRHPGRIPSQGEQLAELFSELGYPVVSVSSFANRYLRLADIVTTLVRERKQIDIFIIDVYSGPSFVVEDIASRIGQRFQTPIVISLHGGGLPQFIIRFPRWSTRVLSRADRLVAQSDYLLRAVESVGFGTRVIPNVINVAAYPHRVRTSVKPRLLWMRAFHQIYNPVMALRVLAKVRTELPEATLTMAGQDNGLQADMQALAAKLGIQGSVRFPGFLNMADKIREGQHADIFINTTRIDNSPVCVVEACAMGLPVVSTNVGGVPDLVTHEKTALLVPDDDVEAMARSVLRLVEDPALSSTLSRNGRELASASAPENVCPKWEKLFSEVLAERNGSAVGRS